MKKTLTTLAFALLAFHLSAQKILDVTAGIGVPECINIGVRAQLLTQLQFGLSAGKSVPENDGYLALNADLYFHFAKEGKYSPRKLWFFHAGVTRITELQARTKDTFLFLNSRIGKDVFFSKRMGLTFDMGFSLSLYHDTVSEVQGDENDGHPLFFPSAQVGLFYRL